MKHCALIAEMQNLLPYQLTQCVLGKCLCPARRLVATCQKACALQAQTCHLQLSLTKINLFHLHHQIYACVLTGVFTHMCYV
jgi:hypothetical protein